MAILAPRSWADALAAGTDQVLAVEADLAGDRGVLAGMRAHDGHPGDALAGPGFSDDADGAAALHAEGDAVVGGELHAQVGDLQQRASGGQPGVGHDQRGCRVCHQEVLTPGSITAYRMSTSMS